MPTLRGRSAWLAGGLAAAGLCAAWLSRSVRNAGDAAPGPLVAASDAASASGAERDPSPAPTALPADPPRAERSRAAAARERLAPPADAPSEGPSLDQKYAGLDRDELERRLAELSERAHAETRRRIEERHAAGLFQRFPYQHDESGALLPSWEVVPLPPLDGSFQAHEIVDAPDAGEWHLVTLPAGEHAELVALHEEIAWLGARVEERAR